MSFTLLVAGLLGIFYALARRFQDSLSPNKIGSVTVIVIGDIGRSPRIRNHALSLANTPAICNHVTLIGYTHTSIPKAITEHPSISILPIKVPQWDPQNNTNPFVRILSAVLKNLSALAFLWLYLGKLPHLKAVIIQNPPATPHSLLLRMITWLRSAKFIIDCHNYGYTIARLDKSLKKISLPLKILEFLGLRCADLVWCVSNSMQSDLLKTHGLKNVHVVYDKPPKSFTNPSPTVCQRVMSKYLDISTYPPQTAIIITSTSFTPDEDLTLLLKSLALYVQKAKSIPNLPKIILIVTGKGSSETLFDRCALTISQSISGWEHTIQIKRVFCDVDDYPKLLGCAHLGICLHKSSSGLDLPMKLVDMMGVRIPAVAYRYAAIDELIDEKMTFESAEELTTLLVELLAGNEKISPKWKNEVGSSCWEDEWASKALPSLKKLMQ